MADPRQILIIDDDPDFLDYLEIILAANGYEVQKATGADQGLALMRACCPALVIVDVMMSYVLDGWAIGREIRDDPPCAACRSSWSRRSSPTPTTRSSRVSTRRTLTRFSASRWTPPRSSAASRSSSPSERTSEPDRPGVRRHDSAMAVGCVPIAFRSIRDAGAALGATTSTRGYRTCARILRPTMAPPSGPCSSRPSTSPRSNTAA